MSELNSILIIINFESFKNIKVGEISMRGEKWGHYRFLIGVEVETSIYAGELEGYYWTCDQCSECYVCSYCIEDRMFCENCDTEIFIEIWKYIYNTLGYKVDITDHGEICRLCLENAVWTEFFCPNCEPTEACEYINNPDPELFDLMELIELDGRFDPILPYINSVEIDGSCGLEFQSKTFNNLKEYFNFLRIVYDTIDHHAMLPKYWAGGHTNISWENSNCSWIDYDNKIAYNSLLFSPLLVYMFTDSDINERERYIRYFDYSEKFSPIRLKDYAIEFRLFHSIINPDNHFLGSVTALCITYITKPLTKLNDRYYKIKNLYYDLLESYNFKETYDQHKDTLELLYKELIKHIKDPLKYYSKILNIDLLSALQFRYKHPQDSFPNFSLTKFAKSKKTFKPLIPHYQKTLIAYSII